MRELSGLFVDENLLPVGRALDQVARPHRVLYPGHDECPEIPLGTEDVDLLPFVGEHDLLLVTRDKKITTRPGEIGLVHAHKTRLIVFRGKQDLSPAEALKTFLNRWDKISKQAAALGAGPWALSITKAGGPDALPLKKL